jgi:hypothetical protein
MNIQEVIEEAFKNLYFKKQSVSFSNEVMSILKSKTCKEYNYYIDEEKYKEKRIVSIEVKQ